MSATPLERIELEVGAAPRALAVLAVSFGLALWQPLWLLLVAPLVFGVPHVGADLRFLLLRPRRAPPRAVQAVLWAPLGVLLALRGAYLLTGWMSLRLELGIGLATLVLAGVFASRSGSARTALVAAGAVAYGLAWQAPAEVAIALGHVHNFVALGLWLWWLGPGRARWAVFATAVAGVAFMMSGVLDGVLIGFAGSDAAGLTLSGMLRALAPSLPAPWDLRAVLLFSWMQAVHYGLWLFCMVQVVPPRSTSWRDDLGSVGLAVLVLGSLALPLLGLWSPVDARSGYLSLVLFHGWLELAVVTWLGITALDA